MAVKRNAAKASVYIRGMHDPDAKMENPRWSTGFWTVNVDTFFLVNTAYTWKFTRDQSIAKPRPLPRK
mgnify:CR=1 FL=1